MKAWNWLLDSPAPVWGTFISLFGFGLAKLINTGVFA